MTLPDITQHHVATPIPNGYSWTLASRLGDILRFSEDAYGERDKSYTILGIEYGGQHPQIWFPGDCKQIVIQLSQAAMGNLNQAIYQMAHEAIHLLSPTGHSEANNLEEGLATLNSFQYMAQRMGDPTWRSTINSYTAAKNAVANLLKVDPDAIKKIRAQKEPFGRASKTDLIKALPFLGDPEAAYLSSKFRQA